MRQLINNPAKSGARLTIVCFVSGSGTNYARIAEKDPNHDYLVFSNRHGCGGVEKARQNNHPVVELSHIPYLRDARKKYGPGAIPRNCPERVKYEQDLWSLVEDRLHKKPDVICLAGYDQWTTDWMVDRYYPRILNVHPGDTTKGYDGLHWIPSAKAILAGDKEIRSTLFLVDKGEDTGPVLVQSRPLDITQTLETSGIPILSEALRRVTKFAGSRHITDYTAFEKTAAPAEKELMQQVCEHLQEALKVAGDWEIYPFAVHELIARGRVAVDGRAIYIDGAEMPAHGYRLDM